MCPSFVPRPARNAAYNAPAVRRCRKRKQDHIAELERRVAELEGENVELRRQIRVRDGEEQDDPRARANLRAKRLEIVRRFVAAVNEVRYFCYICPALD
jgi:hypothetical protein